MTTTVDEIATRIYRLSTFVPEIDRLAALAHRTLALMHGSSFTGDCQTALHTLADAYRQRIAAAA